MPSFVPPELNRTRRLAHVPVGIPLLLARCHVHPRMPARPRDGERRHSCLSKGGSGMRRDVFCTRICASVLTYVEE